MGVIVCGLAGRAALDKLLALRGGGELVAQWAQLFSVVELVSGAALSGVGTGVSVAVAQTHDARAQRAVLGDALRLGLLVSACVAVAALPLAFVMPAQASWLALGAAVGLLTVVHGTFNGYWLGQKHRGRMLLLALALALAPLAAAVAAPVALVLPIVAVAHALPGLALLAFVPRGAWWRSVAARRAEPAPPLRPADPVAAPLPPPAALAAEPRAVSPLRAYVLPGLVIGILSPASTWAARALVAERLSWHDAGVLQALWRLTDWVGVIAAGVLSIFWLPRLSAAAGTARVRAVLRQATLATALPSAAALTALFVVQAPALALLYDASFRVPSAAAAMLFAGVALRVVAWAGLVALYAQRRTVAIAVGELLSLPLFAALVAAWPGALTLERVCAAWLAAFAAYAAFNLCAGLRAPNGAAR